jgi:hypothetical protein
MRAEMHYGWQRPRGLERTMPKSGMLRWMRHRNRPRAPASSCRHRMPGWRALTLISGWLSQSNSLTFPYKWVRSLTTIIDSMKAHGGYMATGDQHAYSEYIFTFSSREMAGANVGEPAACQAARTNQQWGSLCMRRSSSCSRAADHRVLSSRGRELASVPADNGATGLKACAHART